MTRPEALERLRQQARLHVAARGTAFARRTREVLWDRRAREAQQAGVTPWRVRAAIQAEYDRVQRQTGGAA